MPPSLLLSCEGGRASRGDELIRKAQKGDSRAFEEIVRVYQGYLFAAVLPIVGGSDVAQDVLQETFLKAFRSMASYKGPNLKGWLGRIAVNAAVDWKRANTRLTQAASSLSDIEHARSQQVRSPEEEFLDRAGHGGLANALGRLPVQYQRVFIQRYADGLDHKTIAASEGVSLRTVESRLYRARRMLKEVLAEE